MAYCKGYCVACFKRLFGYITKTLYYLPGFLVEIVKDFVHIKLQRRQPLWRDATPCHRSICRFCGGKVRVVRNKM